LGVAEVLSRMRDQVPGTVKFIFQPAEEGPPPGEEGGARLMIKEGVLADPRPAAIFGLHCSPEIEVGRIGARAGAAQAAADNFDITIRGRMAHAAAPHKGVDAIVVAAECVTALQSIHSRRVDTFEPLILTIGTLHGGNRRNILAPEVRMEGTVRTLSEEVRGRVKELMEKTLAGVTAAHGATHELTFSEVTRVVYNDPKLVEDTLPTLRRVVGETGVVTVPQRMGAEDFSYFQEVVPGFYFRLGVGNKARGITADTHTPEFDVDEECLVVGVKVMAQVLLDFLERQGR
jgi:amidohydrolase